MTTKKKEEEEEEERFFFFINVRLVRQNEILSYKVVWCVFYFIYDVSDRVLLFFLQKYPAFAKVNLALLVAHV